MEGEEGNAQNSRGHGTRRHGDSGPQASEPLRNNEQQHCCPHVQASGPRGTLFRPLYACTTDRAESLVCWLVLLRRRHHLRDYFLLTCDDAV